MVAKIHVHGSTPAAVAGAESVDGGDARERRLHDLLLEADHRLGVANGAGLGVVEGSAAASDHADHGRVSAVERYGVCAVFAGARADVGPRAHDVAAGVELDGVVASERRYAREQGHDSSQHRLPLVEGTTIATIVEDHSRMPYADTGSFKTNDLAIDASSS
jgi:hypothetical protein